MRSAPAKKGIIYHLEYIGDERRYVYLILSRLHFIELGSRLRGVVPVLKMAWFLSGIVVLNLCIFESFGFT